MGPSAGAGYERGAPPSKTSIFSELLHKLQESQRMALVITSHHKYVQDSNRALAIHSRIGVVMTLLLELWPSIICSQMQTRLFLYMLSVLHCGL